MIKIVEFDVIMQDITNQCFYGLWEVKIKQSTISEI